ncbi:protein MCM10 homolog isoform X2 [Ptychodera flava]|uniref:protein MCM10 homolog isoform X2 n=1 Tax=Ptychodera flava TaxID=63121 RepID=UPI00396A52F6
MDDDYDMDDLDTLTALLDEDDDTQYSSSQSFNYEERPGSSTNISVPNNESTCKTTKVSNSQCSDGNVEDKPTQDLMEELRLMKDRVKQLEAQVKQTNNSDRRASQELFSSAITPTTDCDGIKKRKSLFSSAITPNTDCDGIKKKKSPTHQIAKNVTSASTGQNSFLKDQDGGKICKDSVKSGPSQPFKSSQFSSAATCHNFPGTSTVLRNNSKQQEEDAAKYETEVYSQIRTTNPLISSAMMKKRMEGRKMVRMSVLQRHINTNQSLNGDWVTIGVIVNKIPPKTSANGKQYSIWKLNDLHNVNIVIALFLFGDVHKEHWKASVGTVVGLLNAEVMSKKDGTEETSLKVDHPQKIMIMGTSKDLGWCKARRKDGKSCSMFVNKVECEYCQYHVQSAYKKMSGKRTELQSSYTGSQPKAFKDHLKNQTIFYGGQTFTSKQSTSKKSSNVKDKNNLKTLNLAKAKQLQDCDRVNMMKMNSLSTKEAADFLSIANGNEEFQNRLVTPTLGSQNLLRHMKKVEQEDKVKKGLVETITASDLLKMQRKRMHEQQQARKRKLSASSGSEQCESESKGPMLGRGLQRGQDLYLDFGTPLSQSKKSLSANIAKRKAVAIVTAKGPLKKQDPNAAEKSRKLDTKTQEQIQKRVADNIQDSPHQGKSEQPRKKRKFLGSDLAEMDTNSEDFLRVVQAQSKYSALLHEVEDDLQEKYFNELEKKEKLETKMSSILEKVCKVVSCHQCKYTYFSPAARCKQENHSLKWHEAKQRFFLCKDCKTKMFTFNKIPNTSCRNCGGSKFDRTSMLTERKGPRLGGETLLLRGEEQKWV